MAADRGPKTKGNKAQLQLPYQLILYLNGWYFGVFVICELLMYIYKGEVLPFPPSNLAAEVCLVLILAGLEAIRLFFGRKGNLTEQVMLVGLSIAFSLVSVLGCVYLLLWQTYVLRAEVILIVIQLVLIGIETLLGIIAMVLFARAEPY